MASSSRVHVEDFGYFEDIDALLNAIEEGDLSIDPVFDADLNHALLVMEEESSEDEKKCLYCEKVCKSKSGMARHVKAKHPDEQQQTPVVVKKARFDGRHVNLECFERLLVVSLKKLKSTGLETDEVLDELEKCVFSREDVSRSFSVVRDIIVDFESDGNGEKFLPSFFDCVFSKCQEMFPLLSRDAAFSVGMDMAVNIKAYLVAGFVDCQKDVSVFVESADLSKKEIDVVAYLGGYVFSTFSRRIRRSKDWNSVLSQKNLALLFAGKVDVDVETGVGQNLINVRNRGGLWNVRKEVVILFSIVEKYFKTYCDTGFVRRFDTPNMVSELITHPDILANYSVIYNDTEQEISEEFALNLLEHLITLYLRLRSFSYAKDKVQQHKMASKSSKKRSLRTEIKKATSTLEQGH